MSTPAAVISFWRMAGSGKWFNGGKAFDDDCRRQFGDVHMAAARREFDGWMDTPDGALGLLLLLDQIPRNIFRGSGHAFATDGLALQHAKQAVKAGSRPRRDRFQYCGIVGSNVDQASMPPLML